MAGYVLHIVSILAQCFIKQKQLIGTHTFDLERGTSTCRDHKDQQRDESPQQFASIYVLASFIIFVFYGNESLAIYMNNYSTTAI